jgi:hypothetical protein
MGEVYRLGSADCMLPLSMFACFLGSRPVLVQAAEIEEIPKGMTTIIYSLSCRT